MEALYDDETGLALIYELDADEVFYYLRMELRTDKEGVPTFSYRVPEGFEAWIYRPGHPGLVEGSWTRYRARRRGGPARAGGSRWVYYEVCDEAMQRPKVERDPVVEWTEIPWR